MSGHSQGMAGNGRVRRRFVAGPRQAENAVSYTHLDVYKRQVYLHGLDLTLQHGMRFYDEGETPQTSRLARNFARLIEPSFRFAAQQWRGRGVSAINLSPVSALPPEAVSYTHLDVYKRQQNS